MGRHAHGAPDGLGARSLLELDPHLETDDGRAERLDAERLRRRPVHDAPAVLDGALAAPPQAVGAQEQQVARQCRDRPVVATGGEVVVARQVAGQPPQQLGLRVVQVGACPRGAVEEVAQRRGGLARIGRPLDGVRRVPRLELRDRPARRRSLRPTAVPPSPDAPPVRRGAAVAPGAGACKRTRGASEARARARSVRGRALGCRA